LRDRHKDSGGGVYGKDLPPITGARSWDAAKTPPDGLSADHTDERSKLATRVSISRRRHGVFWKHVAAARRGPGYMLFTRPISA